MRQADENTARRYEEAARLKDEETARHLRKVCEAATAFNAAVDAAQDAGLEVGFLVSTWTATPSKSYIADLRVTKPFDLLEDSP